MLQLLTFVCAAIVAAVCVVLALPSDAHPPDPSSLFHFYSCCGWNVFAAGSGPRQRSGHSHANLVALPLRKG